MCCALAHDGVLFGGSSGAVPPFDPMILSQKGSLFLTRPTLFQYMATREELVSRCHCRIFAMIAVGTLKIHFPRVLCMAEAQQAHRDLKQEKPQAN